MKRVSVILLFVISLTFGSTSVVNLSGVADGSNGFSFFYNPANIAFVTESEVMTNYRFLSMDRNFIYIGYLTPLNKNIGLKKEAVLAVGVLYAGVTDIDGRDNDGKSRYPSEN